MAIRQHNHGPERRPSCPEHESSHVVFDGSYGKPGHRRPLYRCYPGGRGGRSEPFHRFTEPLPREAPASGECQVCERTMGRHDGLHVPRQHLYTARTIGEALIAVGHGETYQSASWRARQRADRFPQEEDGTERETAHGQLVADWVEVYAPVVFAPHQREAWPTGSLVVDHLPFRVKARDPAGRPIPGGKVAFNVMAAVGYDNGHAKLWRLGSAPTASTGEWEWFFGRLEGTPERVVCDAHTGLSKAVRNLWPETDIYYSEWHLADKMRLRLRRAGMNLPSEPLWRALDVRAVDYAFASHYLWEHYKVKAWRARSRCPELQTWIDRWDPVICAQLARRPRRDERPNSWPITTAALERQLNRVKDWVTPRRHGFRNRERMDRLLMLMQLELNGYADPTRYAKCIRDWLGERHGTAPRRRALVDPHGHPSLRV